MNNLILIQGWKKDHEPISYPTLDFFASWLEMVAQMMMLSASIVRESVNDK